MKKPLTEKQIEETLNTLPISAWEYPRVLCFVLKTRSLSHMNLVFNPFMRIAAMGVPMLDAGDTRVDLARNKGAIALLRSNYTHLLMLDADHAHPRDIVQKLSRWVMRDPEGCLVVGGWNAKRSYPHEPCAWFEDDDGVLVSPYEYSGKGLTEVDVIGTGSLLISRKVFERIEPPWFAFKYDAVDVWRDYWRGEDIYSSQLCRKNGIKVYLDTSVKSPHVVETTVTVDDYAELVKTGQLKSVKTLEFKRVTKPEFAKGAGE